jgi:Tfp pilus assembly protein PilN
MARFLAVRWNTGVLRFVCADADRSGRLTIVDAGQRMPTDAQAVNGTVDLLRQLVREMKCEKQRVLILIGRGAVESITFDVPPATADELPLLVQNLAAQKLPGLHEDSSLDFIAYPPRADGSRSVSALAIMVEEQSQLRQLREHCGCRSVSILVAPHSLRAFAAVASLPAATEEPTAVWGNQTPVDVTLLIARGHEQTDVLACTASLPLLSRTIRMPGGMQHNEAAEFLIAETQRTLVSVGGHLAQRVRVNRIILVGSTDETHGLTETLADHYHANVEHMGGLGLAAMPLPEMAEENPNSADYAALLGAVSEASRGIIPAVDFAAPRRPRKSNSGRSRWFAAAAGLLLLTAGAVGYVWSQFDEIDQENQRLSQRLQELSQLVRDTEAKRALVATMSAWEKNRISWPDELLELTQKIPARPGITLQQLSAAPAGPGTSVLTFSGVGRPPELIAEMERNLRDSRHDIRIPGVREQLVGKEIHGTFQATLTIRNARPPAAQPRTADTGAYGADSSQTSGANVNAESIAKGQP